MRTHKSKINILFGMLGQAINMMLAIVSRAVLASMMPSQYLGINGLFTNLLTILSLAELGIGTAMMFAFYEPVAQNDTARLQKLMNLYRRLYRIVAAVIAGIGLVMIPFLGFIIKTDTPIEHLTLIYLLYLLQSVSSYLYVYKTVIIIAFQNEYICTIYNSVFTILRYVLQIAILFLTANFYLYLCIHIACNLLPNFLASRKAERMYPYITENLNVFPSKEEQKAIFLNIRATFMHRVGSVMVYNVDDIIMSAFIGLSTVGIYSNYKMVSNNINTFASRIFSALTASVGNLVAEEKENQEKLVTVFSVLQLALFFIYSYCSVAMAICFRPFILTFFSAEYVFPTSSMLLVIALFYLTGMRMIVQQFNSTMGLFRYDRYKAIIEAFFNLIVSIYLVKRIGLNGIFIGTVLDLLLIPYIVEPYVLFKHGLNEHRKRNMIQYYLNFVLRTALMVLCGYVIYRVLDHVPVEGFCKFFLDGILVTILYGCAMLAIFCRTKTFRLLADYGRKALKRAE